MYFWLILVIVLIVLLLALMKYLMKQSQQPSGIVGVMMMKLWNKTYLPMVRWAIDSDSYSSVNQLLDIGVGNGLSTAYLEKKFPNSTLVGIDISATAIEEANKNYSSSAITFLQANIQKTTFPNQSFDFICAFQNHFHWDDMNQAFQEVARILTTDGTFLIACEYSKVSYFLKGFTTIETFGEFLRKHDLDLQATKRYRGWILYKIGKFSK